jgi:NADH-quinone oxidoreductase subunit E
MNQVTLSAETRAQIERVRERYPQPRSAILPCLWAVQQQFGYLPPEGMTEVAGMLGVAPSEVQAVSTFYSMYFTRPEGRHHLLVCVNVACALRGAEDTVTYLEQRLSCPSGSTTADGMFTWESTIECLGACGGAPMMQIDHRFHENLTPERIDAILTRIAGESGDGRQENGHAPVRTPSPSRKRARRAGKNDDSTT